MSERIGWSRGYPVSEPYPPAWHAFQSPAHLKAICTLMGVAWDVDPETPLSIAEVGCGTGYTAQVLAAGNPHWEVCGLDYNPAHIAEARSMAAAARLTNLRFIEADLAELGGRDLDALPEFDLVTVHGVWSWVSDPVREGVLELLKHRLKAGGLVLVTYNALPGAAGTTGLSRLVRGEMLSAGRGIDGIERAARLVERLIAAEPAHMPSSAWRRLFTGEIKGARPGYLLHEFYTEHWRPCFHADVATALATARCDYVGSASIDENFPRMSLSPEQRALWDEAPDASARELVFDLCVPRAFRRDLFVRGLRRVARDEAIDAITLASTTNVQGHVILRTQAGEATLPAELVDSVRAALAEKPQRIAHLRTLPGCNKATPAELLAVLVGSGCAMPLWREPGEGPSWSDSVAAAGRLNHMAAERLTPHGAGMGQFALASPALGGGFPVTAMELAVARLVSGEAVDAPDVDHIVSRLLPEGQQPPAEVLSELRTVVRSIRDDRLAPWRALGAV
jgi:SAM-dependent methyltransferase